VRFRKYGREKTFKSAIFKYLTDKEFDVSIADEE
jgi:hypothetical protein